MQNIFTRVKVKMAQGVSGTVAKKTTLRSLIEFHFLFFPRQRKHGKLFPFRHDRKKLSIFHGNCEALTAENQTSNFVISFATAR